MKKRNLFALALCAVMCVSAVGCGGGGKGKTISKVTGGDEEDKTAYSGIEEYAGTTLKFATWIDHTAGEGAAPMSSFAEKYDIEVEITPVP